MHRYRAPKLSYHRFDKCSLVGLIRFLTLKNFLFSLLAEIRDGRAFFMSTTKKSLRLMVEAAGVQLDKDDLGVFFDTYSRP